MKNIITLVALTISFNVLSIEGNGTERHLQVCSKIGADGTEINSIGADGTEVNNNTDVTKYCQIILKVNKTD